MRYLLLLLLLLTSCGRGYVYPSNIKRAEEVCKDKGGLHHIEARAGGDGSCEDEQCGGKFAVCNNKSSTVKDDILFELK